MRKIFFALCSVLILGSSCQDFNERNFEGYEDLTRPRNIAKYEYTITDTDISNITTKLFAAKTKRDSIMANALKADKAFSALAPTDTLVPIILNDKYYTADKTSTAAVTLPYKGTDMIVDSLTQQFVFTGFNQSKWVFDPTFHFTMVKVDYQLIVDYVMENFDPALGLVNIKYKNQEYYYGSNANFANISWREKDRVYDATFPQNGTDAEKQAYFNERTQEGLAVMLAKKYPAATPLVSGIQQEAIVTFIVYTTVNATTTYRFKCVKDGAAPILERWEFVEEVK